jgi:uncharacterized protein YjgD (DUF1641 family)
MSTKTIEKEIQEIHQKLDFITQHMGEYQRRQREMDELKKDLSIIGKDVFDSAIEELQDVAPYFNTNDLLFLLKKLLRNTRNLNKLLSQLESASDLYQDLRPLGKHIFDEILETLDDLDKKGYFDFMRESAKIFDTIVTSFTVQDVRHLRENIASILLTLKSMTQPEMLKTMNNALDFFKKMDIEVTEKTSYIQLFKELRNPEVKQGLFFMLEFVKNMAKNGNHNDKISS